MTTDSLNIIRNLLFAALLIGSASATAQEPQKESDNVGCGLRIAVPNYPNLTVGARITGTAMTSVLLRDGGRIATLEVSNVHPLLKRAVEEALRKSEFSPDCNGKRLRLIYEFTIAGKPVAHPKESFVFVPPNKFVVTSAPYLPIAD